MCEQCAAATEDIGEVLPGYRLVRASRNGMLMRARDFGIVSTGDPDVVWTGDPTIDPTFGKCEEYADNLSPRDAAQLDDFRDWADGVWASWKVDVETGYEIYKASLAAGYDRRRHGLWSYWLFHRVGVVWSEWTAAN